MLQGNWRRNFDMAELIKYFKGDTNGAAAMEKKMLEMFIR
jgi:hypothetical protein